MMRLLNIHFREGSILGDWRTGLIVLIWKRQGNVQDLGKYRGITLPSHIMKVLERILDGRMRNERQRKRERKNKGSGRTDAIFTLRHLVENSLEIQGEMT